MIGALRVVLGADTAALDKGLKDAQSGVAKFGAGLGTAMAAAGAAAAAAASAIGFAVKGAIDNADKMSKMSQSFGVPVEELSRLKYAADLSDVSLEALGKNVGKLSRNMVEVAGGGIGPAKQAFDALGVSVTNTDGTLKTSSQVIGEVAGKFETYQDGAAKTALAMALFGKSGAEMIPLLNSGRDGLKEMSDEADRLGLVIDAKTGKSAEAFNDNLTRLQRVIDGIVLKLSAAALPTLVQFTEALVDASKNTNLLGDATSTVDIVLKAVVNELAMAAAYMQRVRSEWNALTSIFKSRSLDDLKKAWESFNAEGVQTEIYIQNTKNSLNDFWNNAKTEAEKSSKTVSEKMSAPIIQAAEASENAVEKYLSSQAKRIAGMTAEAQTIGLSAAAHEKLKLQLEAEAIAKEKNIPLTDALSLRIAAAGDAAALAAMKVQAAQIAQQVLSPAEKYAQDLQNLQQVYAATSMTMETFTARQQQLAEGIGATWAQAGSTAASGFGELASVFAKESKGMATTAKAFGIIEATINTYVAFTKALSSGIPPFNYIAAAGTLAAGMAKVAAIKSQSFMTGGSMTVRGSGGPDSVPVMVSPGETIDVYRADEPGPDPRRASGGGDQRVYNIATPLVLSRDWVRDVFQALNEGLGDGHRLNVVPV
ncbi:MAG: hypothetical protein ACOY6K_05430 [Pseudomonadota bacterium]